MHYIEAVSYESRCADWQSNVIENLKDLNVTIYNPRRKYFPMDDPSAAIQQIKWEFNKLRESDFLFFWFSPETLNPIVLFEYGAALERRSEFIDIVVGVHPDYKRKTDIIVQTNLKYSGIKIHESLSSATNELYNKIRLIT